MRQHLFLNAIKYDKSLRRCETLIGNYLESEWGMQRVISLLYRRECLFLIPLISALAFLTLERFE